MNKIWSISINIIPHDKKNIWKKGKTNNNVPKSNILRSFKISGLITYTSNAWSPNISNI